MRGIKRKIKQALEAANAEVKAHADRGGMYARGLAGEGYAGGYREALNDVLLAANGVKPQNRFWSAIKFEGYE